MFQDAYLSIAFNPSICNRFEPPPIRNKISPLLFQRPPLLFLLLFAEWGPFFLDFPARPIHIAVTVQMMRPPAHAYHRLSE